MMRFDRRHVMGALAASLAAPVAVRAQNAPVANLPVYETYPKPGTPKLVGADNSRRVIPAPPKDYWPFKGLSGPGAPVTKTTQKGGWVSNLSEVRYKGPKPPTYALADWADADSGSAVTKGLLPAIRPIWDVHLRDTIVILGGDGYYYMTGTGGENCWAFNDGIELWRSRDLETWDYLGLVWSIERDGTWQKNWTRRAGVPFRSIWAPEIHYINKTYYLCLCISGVGIGVLKSTTGKPEGPYAAVLSNEPIKGGIDATLFQDDDGKIYLAYGAAQKVREIKPDFSDFAGDWQAISYDSAEIAPSPEPTPSAEPAKPVKPRRLGFEGVTIFKANGRYYLAACEHHEGRYSFMFMTAQNLFGPYSGRHEGPAGAGGGNIFRDKMGQWWQTFFGNDDQMPFREKPGLIAIEFDADGKVRAAKSQRFAPL